MANADTEQKASLSPPQDETNVSASVAVCEENLEALLRGVTGRPEPESPIAPPAEVAPPEHAEAQAPVDGALPVPATLQPVTSQPVTSNATVEEPAAEGAAEKSPVPEAHLAEAHPETEVHTAEASSHPAAAHGPAAPAAESKPKVVSKLALIASIKQRRAATAHHEPEISSTAVKQTTSAEVPPAEPAIVSATAQDAVPVAVPIEAEQSVHPPEESNASPKEISPRTVGEPHREARPSVPVVKSAVAYSTPVGGTLFAGVERPVQDAAPGAVKRLATSGPVLGTLAGVILTVGVTTFLLIGHATKSTTTVSKQAAQESVQKQDTGAGIQTTALAVEERSSAATPSQASAGADNSRKDDKGAAKSEPARSAQATPAQSTQAAPAQPPAEASRTVARTFAPPIAGKTSPESGPILDAPPTLSAVPSAPLAPGVGALPSRITPPPPAAPPAAAPGASLRQINVAGSVQALKLIKKVAPPYPALARTAHVEGTVRFRAVIGADGQVKGLVTLSGPPPLVQPAADAVKQWRYQPTLRNGEAVEVVTEINVAFTL